MLLRYKFTLLLVLVAIVVLQHYGLHKNANAKYDVKKTAQWRQPAVLNEEFPLLISNDNWRRDYTNVERLLWKSKVSASGELIINSETAELLTQAAALLPERLDKKGQQRLTLLIEKSRSGLVGKQLASLLIQYYFYQRDYQSSLSAIDQAKEDEKLAMLSVSDVDNRKRQERYFGVEIAAKLFRKQNLAINYLNARRIVNLDASLSKAQKRAKLSALQNDYKRTLSTQE